MKLGIFCNFVPPSVGGSETVIRHISKYLLDHFNYKVNMYGFNVKKDLCLNGISIYPCLKHKKLINQINENECVLIYSDSFWGWTDILNNLEEIKSKICVALVGAYHMRGHPETADKFFNNISRFKTITHFDGSDYHWCIENGIEAHIIPNGIDLMEFDQNNIDFRKKYKIEEKYVLLNVSNFFYGKGQEYLPIILSNFERALRDFVLIQVSNSIEYPYEKNFIQRFEQLCKRNKINYKLLRNISREEVVSSFRESDVFVFTSRKEVSPLVIMESQAAYLPWISLSVGDVLSKKGGKVLYSPKKDSNGYCEISDEIINQYRKAIYEILSDLNLTTGKSGTKNLLIHEGRKQAEKKDWSQIVPLYHEIFSW